MDIILMLIQFVTLVQISSLNDKPIDDTEELSEYLKGRDWVCNEYYRFGRSIEELDAKFKGVVFDPNEFQQGAIAALRELHRRHDEI